MAVLRKRVVVEVEAVVKEFRHQDTSDGRRPRSRMSLRRHRRSRRRAAASLSRLPGEERWVIPSVNKRRDREGRSESSRSEGRGWEGTDGSEMVLRSKGVRRRWLSHRMRM